MKRVIICGATGFIGRNLVEYYSSQDEFDVIAVSHLRPEYDLPNITWVNADLRDAGQVDQLLKGADVVIQAAATTSGAKDITSQPFVHVTDNAVMNSLLLRSAYEHSIKNFIFFSCTVMYPSSEAPVHENDFNGEITDKYFGVGWTKVYIERMCEFYANLGRTKHTVIRHSNIYGPHDKFDLERSHVFGATVTKTMLADDELSIWGTGEEKRDLLHVSDLVNFVSLAIANQKDSYGLYNCGLGKSVSVKELVEKVVKASGKKLALKHDLSKPTIPFNLCLDCRKAETDLGWLPKIDLDTGVQDTVKWWRDNIDPDTLSYNS